MRTAIDRKAMNKALFLDRDGTINEYGEYIYLPKDFVFIKGAVEFIRKFNVMGYKVIVISNQAGIARGYYTEKDLLALQRWVDGRMESQKAKIDAWYYCPHHPIYGKGKYLQDCDCRKPKTGMLDRAVKDFDIDIKGSIMVGDKEWDAECGERAGVKSFLLRNNDYSLLNNEVDKYLSLQNSASKHSLLIVNKNNAALTENAVKDFYAKYGGLNEVVIVDNNSSDASLERLRSFDHMARLLAVKRDLSEADAIKYGRSFVGGIDLEMKVYISE